MTEEQIKKLKPGHKLRLISLTCVVVDVRKDSIEIQRIGRVRLGCSTIVTVSELYQPAWELIGDDGGRVFTQSEMAMLIARNEGYAFDGDGHLISHNATT